ncbi:MAG: hypothetical protein RIS47_1690, partial [Bacteroidota bacterium]
GQAEVFALRDGGVGLENCRTV